MKKPSELIDWAIKEIRGLDELCRSMVPGYEPLDSDDMETLASLKRLRDSLEPTPDDEPEPS